MMRIGVISDTHGVVHARIAEVFRGVDAIVHAGDIGGEHVVAALEQIAPVTSVDGNVDDGYGTNVVRTTIGELRILLTHVLPRPRKLHAHVAESLAAEPADVVIFGHSHLPHDEVVAGVRYFNPASAGPRRFDYPTSVGIFERKRGRWNGWHVPLDERSIEALKKRMNQMS
jgi:putative phosphoesterase